MSGATLPASLDSLLALLPSSDQDKGAALALGSLALASPCSPTVNTPSIRSPLASPLDRDTLLPRDASMDIASGAGDVSNAADEDVATSEPRRCAVLQRSAMLLLGLMLCTILGWQGSAHIDRCIRAHFADDSQIQAHGAADPTQSSDSSAPPAPPAVGSSPIIQTLVAFTQFDETHFSYGLNTLSAIGEWMIVESGQPSFNVTIAYYCTNASDIRPWLHLLPPSLRDRFRVFVYPRSIGFGLPLEHRSEFVRQRHSFDLFIYMENDILIRRHHMHSWFRQHLILFHANPIPPEPHTQLTVGFMRYELGDKAQKHGVVTLPDFFSLGRLTRYAIADSQFLRVSYSYAAHHLLTRDQLGIMLARHESAYLADHVASSNPGDYDGRRESGAHGPEFFFGIRKLLPASSPQQLSDHLVHHQPNTYPQLSISVQRVWRHMQRRRIHTLQCQGRNETNWPGSV